MRSFFKELRRRNVYRVGAMYAVAGWLAVQIATQVLPIFEVSALALRLIVLLIVAGFPIALVLSWVYEVTPQGIERTANVEPPESTARHTGRKLDFVIIAALGIAVVYLLVQHYWLPQKTAFAINDKSVAVLPFENLSDDKANAYFAEGVQDEILTRLAKIGALKVISRTSTAHYASNPTNLPEIARQLGVANILEGSVQKVGDAVHINVQLIHAVSDDHLWAEVYNRKLDDVFAVEGEVAGAIADALNAKLTGAEQAALAMRPTENLAAYDSFQRGRALGLVGYDFATARKQIAAYREAVRLDPQFALAWANLARTAGYLYFNGVDADVYTPDLIRQATDNATRLQPQLSEVQLARGNYLYRIARDFSGAEQVLGNTLQHAPNDHDALQFLGLVERRLGKWDKALVHLEQAAQLDPRNAGLMTTIGGETYLNLRRFAEARAWLERALAISPGDALAIGYEASAFQLEGRLTDAARLLDPIESRDIAPAVAGFRAEQRQFERRYAQITSELEPVLARNDSSLDGQRPLLTLYLGVSQRRSGNAAAAQATFARLIADLEPHAAQLDDTNAPSTLALALAYSGRQPEALAQARHAVELFANDAIQRAVAEIAQAQVHVIGGDTDAAISGVEKSLQVPCGLTVAQLRLDPIWDPLRGNPRFEALLAGK